GARAEQPAQAAVAERGELVRDGRQGSSSLRLLEAASARRPKEAADEARQTKKGRKTKLTTGSIFTSAWTAGPAVSFKGSPTASPTRAAAYVGLSTRAPPSSTR